MPFSQCLRCAPSGPPGAWDSLLPDVTGLMSQRGCLPSPPPAAGRELSGKGSVLAAGREFDGLLCRPRGFSLIPLCVLACSPLTLSDKLLSRRLPVPEKKRQLSRRTLNPWPLGLGGGWSRGASLEKRGVDLLPSVWPLFFLTAPEACASEVAFRVGFSGVCGSPAKLWASAICANHCLFIGWDQGLADPPFTGSI